jgi:hypothetical protein
MLQQYPQPHLQNEGGGLRFPIPRISLSFFSILQRPTVGTGKTERGISGAASRPAAALVGATGHGGEQGGGNGKESEENPFLPSP